MYDVLFLLFKRKNINQYNTCYTIDQEISQIFSDYFDSISLDLRNNMPVSIIDPLDYLCPVMSKFFEFSLYDANETFNYFFIKKM